MIVPSIFPLFRSTVAPVRVPFTVASEIVTPELVAVKLEVTLIDVAVTFVNLAVD